MKISFKFSKDEGRLAENLVFIELIRRQKTVYYWKNTKGQEVDFVFNKTKNMIILTKDVKKKEKIDGTTIVFIPLWKWLYFFLVLFIPLCYPVQKCTV